jgi:hypothetical protein
MRLMPKTPRFHIVSHPPTPHSHAGTQHPGAYCRRRIPGLPPAICASYAASHVHIHLIFRYSPRQRARGFATPTTSNLTSAQFPQIAQDNPHHFCLHYFLFSFTSSLFFTFSPLTHVHHSFQIRFLLFFGFPCCALRVTTRDVFRITGLLLEDFQ